MLYCEPGSGRAMSAIGPVCWTLAVLWAPGPGLKPAIAGR
jgi:hypothetical protein